MAKFRKTNAQTVVKDLRALADWLEKDGNTISKKQIAPIVNNICDSLLDQLGAYWSGSVLPSVTMTESGPRFQIIEYHVREAPTCLQCIANTGLE
jgi:hypothetical protein